NWIRGYIFIFDHPYAAVTDEKGIFEIDNLPPGEYLLKAWHEGFGMQEKKIRVKSGEAVDVEIAFSK
ncbi:MAG: carboxypeptidase regulatory-like domain-containing protein, partial [Thermodesulfovibrionia bacterium]|nr:carboxypeptidase regulatory-like domain-containing protein [Thermodesulfovibrionia bacterium]